MEVEPEEVEEEEEEETKPAVEKEAKPLRTLPEPANVLTVGNGDIGQLGLGDQVQTRKKPALLKELAGKRVLKFLAGGGHTIVIVKEKQEGTELWSWGCNDDSALGREGDENFPATISGLEKEEIVGGSCGDYHTAVFDEEGRVWAWGVYKDANGYLGFRKNQEGKQLKPFLITELSGHKIVALASGENSTLALTNKGIVFHWGDTRMGRREVSRLKKEVLKPARVRFPRRKGGVSIIGIYSGTNHFFALSKEGDVFAWGLNNYGQLGLGDLKNRLNPELVPSLSGIGVVELAAGTHHSLALTKDGKVYSFGRGDYGQLGLGSTVEHNTPQLIPADHFAGLQADDEIIRISTGQSHSLAWTKNGVGFAWGFGESLQLTNGEEEDETKPYLMNGQQLEGKRIEQLGGGAQHTVVLVRDKAGAAAANSSSSSSK